MSDKWKWDSRGQYWYDGEGNELTPNGAMRCLIKLREELEEIRDLARTGTAPDMYGFTSLEEWEHYKINRVAGMADNALNK